MPDLMGLKNIVVLNDEAHHCYREKPQAEDDEEPEGRRQGRRRRRTTRRRGCGSPGIEIVKRKLGPRCASIDLSATPFFLRGSGYAEGTLFPWTMSDFSLMDAIECGIVKLPARAGRRQHPRRRDAEVPQPMGAYSAGRCRRRAAVRRRCLDPLSLPTQLQTALEALYGHYDKTFALWEKAGHRVPPCFIVVCNNTVDLEAGLRLHLRLRTRRTTTVRSETRAASRCSATTTSTATRSPRPRTLLIDSEQLEIGRGARRQAFRDMAADEIERFRREIVERTGDAPRRRKDHRPGPAARGR